MEAPAAKPNEKTAAFAAGCAVRLRYWVATVGTEGTGSNPDTTIRQKQEEASSCRKKKCGAIAE